jgi:two-component system phosphate regulon response regulator PhoB
MGRTSRERRAWVLHRRRTGLDPGSRACGGQETARSAESLILPRVVLIDDTPEIAQLLTFALQERGYDVVARGFVTDINELVTEQHADAVVVDCSVLSNSEQLFDEIRSDSSHASLPVVLVSDTPEAADRSLRSRHAQHVLLIPKPFSGSQIARALDELLKASAPPDPPPSASR